MGWWPTILTAVGAFLVLIGGVLGELDKRKAEIQARRLAEQSRDLANESLVRANEVIDNLTSRGSYPSMDAGIDDVSINFFVEVIGEYPLRGVSMRLKEITDFASGFQVDSHTTAAFLKAGRIKTGWSDGNSLTPGFSGLIATIPKGDKWEKPRKFVLDVISESASFHILTTLIREQDGTFSGESVTTRRNRDLNKKNREQHIHKLAPNTKILP